MPGDNETFNEGLTPDQFPILNAYDDSSVIWVVLNNMDYHITLGGLKTLLAANLPDPELPEDVVRAPQLEEALLLKANASALENLVTSEQMQEAIANIAPIDIAAAIATYFETNSAPLPEGVVTDTNIAANETIAQIVESLANKASVESVSGLQSALTQGLAGKADATALSGYATTDDLAQGLAGKANADALVGLVNTQQLEDAMSAKADAEAVQGLVTTAQMNNELSGKADRTDLAEYVTGETLQMSLAEKADAVALLGLATSQEVAEGLAGKLDSAAAEGFATSEQLAEGLGDKADSYALEGLATTEALTQGLAGKADTSSLSSFVTQTQLEELDTGVHVPEAAAPNTVLTVGNAGVVTASRVDDGRTYHVVGGTAHPTADGSLVAPFGTIQAAIDAIPSAQSNAVIVVHPSVGGANYDSIVINDRTNLFIVGEGNIDAHPVKIVGSISITGNTTRVRVKNISFGADTEVNEQLIITGGQGRHYFDNVTFEPRANYTGPVAVISNLTNWVDFVDCNIGGRIELTGEPSVNALVAFRGGNHPKFDLHVLADYLVRMYDCTRIGRINRAAGRMYLSNMRGFYGVEGVGIVSAGEETGILSMDLVSMLTEDGTYMPMALTAGANYRFGNNDLVWV